MKNAFLLSLMCWLLSLSSLANSAIRLNGAGASFPYPIYSKWFSEYQKQNKDVQFNYKPIGSGGGVRQLTAETVDFAASDVPLEAQEQSQLKNGVVEIPTVIGAIAVVYNLKELTAPLNLSGDVLAKIYLGEIQNWDHDEIKKLNPSAKLPSFPIGVIRRADASGTTAIFTEYLSQVSAKWKEKVGGGKAVNWPKSFGAKGNDGITAMVKSTPGAIGYVELAYAVHNHLSYAAILNVQGVYSLPNLENVSKSAQPLVQAWLKKNPKDLRLVGSIVNAGKDSAYPIAAMTYFLLPQKNKEHLAVLKQFLIWAMDQGQKLAPELHYAPLPKELVDLVKKRLQQL